MRVFISADWEGISGIVSWHQEDEERQLTRHLMTAEVNAAVEGALAAGAEEIIVNDSHGSMRNILIEELHPQARLITGSLKELSMVEGISSDLDAAMFIGYHSKMGTCSAVLDHTYSGSAVSEVRINGRPAGETTLNAAVCGYFGVPVALVSGDSSLAEEAAAVGAAHVAVKEGRSRYSACHFHPTVARQRIKEAAQRELVKSRQPYLVPSPVTMELDTPHSAMVDAALLIPGMVKIAPRTVSFTHKDFLVAFKALRAAIVLAGSVSRG